jgi:UDP-GlcNAc:undecaprenyl-phosphate/decaprenyl-phosphate GlcNAc-1-phosphate transferase
MPAAWFALIAPAIVAAIAIAALRRSPLSRRFVDRPNERSLHGAPTPRLGGIGVAAGIAAACASFATYPLEAAFILAALLAAISLADDFHSLPMLVRLAAHFAAAAALAALYVPIADAAPFVAIVLAVAWMTNLFNFMDGADGLAGAMAAIGFGALALAAWSAGATDLALAATAIASAAVGFLAHNFPPARVFLGDAGAIPLGFLAAALGLHGAATGAWPAWFPILVFSPFIADASATLAARVLKGKRFWRAHREHHYQRLALAGWPRRNLFAAACIVMAGAAASALAALQARPLAQLGILLGWAAIYLSLAIAIARTTRRGISQ